MSRGWSREQAGDRSEGAVPAAAPRAAGTRGHGAVVRRKAAGLPGTNECPGNVGWLWAGAGAIKFRWSLIPWKCPGLRSLFLGDKKFRTKQHEIMNSMPSPDGWCVFQFVGRVQFQENKSPLHISAMGALIISASDPSSAGGPCAPTVLQDRFQVGFPSAFQAGGLNLSSGLDLKHLSQIFLTSSVNQTMSSQWPKPSWAHCKRDLVVNLLLCVSISPSVKWAS